MNPFADHVQSFLGIQQLVKPKGTAGRGRGKSVTTIYDKRVGSRLSVGAGPTFPSAWRGHCAEVRPSPRGEFELTISESSCEATPLSERQA